MAAITMRRLIARLKRFSGSLNRRRKILATAASTPTKAQQAEAPPSETPPPEAVPRDEEKAHGSLNNEPDSKDEESSIETSRLEALPSEVRRELLGILQLPELRALTHASPTFFQQLIYDRKYILCRSLQKTLGPACLDAYVVHRLQQQGPQPIKERHAILCELYPVQIRQPGYPLIDSLEEMELLEMANFYLDLVEPVRQHFYNYLVAAAREYCPEFHKDSAPSAMELLRMRRTVYRYQMFCYVTQPIYSEDYDIEEADLVRFFDLFNAWEVEEFYIAYLCIQQVYEGIFQSIHRDLAPDNPRFADQRRPPTPDGAFEIGPDDSGRGLWLEGVTLQGLPLLNKVLTNVHNHEELVDLMQENMVRSGLDISLHTGVFSNAWQSIEVPGRVRWRYELQVERAPSPFQGDVPDGPPLAWTIIWQDTYSSIYGPYLPRALGDWCPFIWDAETIERNGLRDLIHSQWWNDYDPRDNHWRTTL